MKYFILYIFLLCGFSVQAQPGSGGGNKEQKIEALYVAYMTRELNLTEDDAQKFWPVHKQYDNEIRGVRNEADEIENLAKTAEESEIAYSSKRMTESYSRRTRGKNDRNQQVDPNTDPDFLN